MATGEIIAEALFNSNQRNYAKGREIRQRKRSAQRRRETLTEIRQIKENQVF